MNFLSLMYIFIGGGLGSLCRFGMTKWLVDAHKTIVIGTMASNFFSSLILGCAIGYLLNHSISENFKLFLLVGFCGGFSTFSTFSLENFRLLENGQYAAFIANTVLSVIICIIAIAAGVWVGKNIFA